MTTLLRSEAHSKAVDAARPENKRSSATPDSVTGIVWRSNLKLVSQFVKRVSPNGPITLTAIRPDGPGAPTQTFTPDELRHMLAWIERFNVDFNIYFMPNRARHRIMRRAKEIDVGAVRYIAIDIDPLPDESSEDCKDRARRLLHRFRTPPTLVWGSGNGVQAMWRLRPVRLITFDDINACKQRSIGLIQALGGANQGIDSTQSVEHLYRVAGTVNHPNAAKRADGRTTCLASWFSYRPGNIYEITDFPPAKRGYRPALRKGLVAKQEPIGGWDTDAGVRDFVLYLRTTRDLAEEGRSGTAIRTARKGRDYGVSADLTLQLMLEHWAPRCEYTWEDDELNGKVERAYVNAQNDAGCLTIQYEKHKGDRR